MTDANGALVARYDYDAWGRQTQTLGTYKADWGYAGYFVHRASKLYLTWYRAYDPDLGRWASRDPIAEQGGFNLYCYVKNNPTKYVDPFGLWGVGVQIGGSAEIGIGPIGAGATGSLGYGSFFGGPCGGSGGGYIGGGYALGTVPNYAGQVPGAPPTAENPTSILGGYVGAGGGGFLTNANRAEDLNGLSTTFSLNTGFGSSVQYGYGNGTWILSVSPGSLGFGKGASFSTYSTNTEGFTLGAPPLLGGTLVP